MKKIQKIWIWVFFGMFLIPELLWLPVSNYIYQILQLNNSILYPLRSNFVTIGDYSFIWYGLIILIQLLGIFMFSYYLIKLSSASKYKVLLTVLAVLGFILSLVLGLILYLVTFLNISFP